MCTLRFTDDSNGGNMGGRLNKRILAEKWLDPSAYVKWNGNNGACDVVQEYTTRHHFRT